MTLKRISITIFGILACCYTMVAEVADADSWALVRVSAACMRANPGHSSELVSQATTGTPVKILDRTSDWWLVETPEGYQGYVISNSLAAKSPAEMTAWVASPRVVVTSLDQVNATTTQGGAGPRERLSDLVNGAILEVDTAADSDSCHVAIRLPDGRQGYLPATAVTPFDQWASRGADAQRLLDYAYAMEGTPYLWGGTTSKALDCSGLSKTAYFSQGVILLRDASQQAKTGTRMEPAQWRSLQAGDLLFFGNPATGRVTHVAIYDHDGWYIHSSGRVKRNSVDPESPGYIKSNNFLWATRVLGNEGTPGITRVAEHPWYTKPYTK